MTMGLVPQTNENSESDKKMDWKSVIQTVKEELKPYYRQGFVPGLRTMFYRLVSKNILPNTKTKYEKLSQYTAKARMDGILPIDCFVDSNRNMIAGFQEDYLTLDDITVRHYLEKLKNLPEE